MPDPTDQPPLPAGPPIHVTVTDIADKEIDPKQQGLLQALGAQDSGWMERLVVAFLTGFVRLLAPLLRLAISTIDSLLGVLAESFLVVQGEQSEEFYNLVAALITDFTGVQVDATAAAVAFKQRGRVAAMEQVGAAFIDILTGEMAGIEQKRGDTGFISTPGTGIGGLPDAKLSPEQGMKGLRAFLGFVMSFAVREGNTDIFADILPYGIGTAFKDFGEDLSKNLAIGRLTRLALRPIFQNLISTPVTWAMNEQYRPTGLKPAEATRAQLRGFLSTDELRDEMRRAGYNEDKINALIEQNLKDLTLEQLKNLNLAGLLPDDDFDLYLARIGFRADDRNLWRKADDLAEVRKYSITRATTLVNDFLAGEISRTDLEDALVAKGIGGTRLLLSDNEVKTLLSIADHLSAFPRQHLTLAQAHKAFISGIIDVLEWEEFLTRRGYSADDRKILTLQLLMDAGKQAEADKLKAERAAAKAAKTQAPPPTP